MKSLEHIPGAAGLDEAGRGPLAGPVVAAVVVLPEKFDVRGLNDSKQLDLKTRLQLEERIKGGSQWAICFVEPDEIDRINILWASMAAMERAFFNLAEMPLRAFVDGNRVPKALLGCGQAVVKGDGKMACIAAASILAKTARDRHMAVLANTYPQYGFDRHFGYPTPDHFEALQQHGPCPIHRRSFAPIAAFDQGILAI
ncbi:MAG: ribonuclease HII [Chlorobia bacterium]|nr:ribonuclease HII [Fimbriimonadaceae bacterium]